jgi:hypothetical protein
MPQLSVYLDDDTIAQVKERAKASNISVSKFFANALGTYMSSQWPEGFETLFGSISDETFERRPDMPFSFDAERENF